MEQTCRVPPGWITSIGILVSSIEPKESLKKEIISDVKITWFSPATSGNKLLFKVLFSKSYFTEEEFKQICIPGDRLVTKFKKKNGEIVWLMVRESLLTPLEIGKIKDVMEKTKIHLRAGSSKDSVLDSRAMLVISEDVPDASTQPTIIDIPLGRENLEIGSQ